MESGSSLISHQALCSHGPIKNANLPKTAAENTVSQAEIEDSLPNKTSGSKKVSLFIGGMTCSTNLSELQHHLRTLAGTNSGLFISMVNRIKRKSFSGYGIIKNVDQKAAETLLQTKNFKFQGCWYGIKPFLKKKSEISKIRKDRAEKKVYLNGLEESLAEGDLEAYFAKYGQVLHVQISKHPGSSKYKGFGFVEFESHEAANQALSQHQHDVKGVSIVCQQTSVSKVPKDSSRRSSSLSSDSSNPLARDCKHTIDRSLAGKASLQARSASCIPDLLLLCQRVAENHSYANLKFRVRFID